MLIIFTSEGHSIILFWGDPEIFQYYFLTIHLFCFATVNTTVVKKIFIESNCKSKVTVKSPLTNNCNTMVDPTKKIIQL